MINKVSVIICTHNPSILKLNRVLDSLKKQSLLIDNWELLLIDNASQEPLASKIDISWHPASRHIYEAKKGLTYARLCGFENAQSNLFAFVDDDNLLDSDYLTNVVEIASHHLKIAAFGGKVLPEFETEPAIWIRNFDNALAVRDFGNEVVLCNSLSIVEGVSQYPIHAPIGAGLVLRREAAEAYTKSLLDQPERLAFGRSGKRLVSGEDNDIVLTVLSKGWGVGYFPELKLTHLIAADRLTRHYLSNLNYASSRSWVRVLDIHGIRPWPKIPKWGVLPRKAKALLRYQPWKSDEAFVRWKGACGLFEGLSTL